jgi:hypothetical protein
VLVACQDRAFPPRTLSIAAEAAFLKQARSIAPADRAQLLAVLRRYPSSRSGFGTWLRHRRRAFYELDPTTGTWRRLR